MNFEITKDTPTRDKIILSAALLICSQGFNYTSINDIAKKIKISKGTIHHYFPSKELLIAEIASLVFGNVLKKLQEKIKTLEKVNNLELIVFEIAEILTSDSEFVRLKIFLLQEALSGDEKLIGLFSGFYNSVSEILGQKLKKVKNINGESAAITSSIIIHLEGAAFLSTFNDTIYDSKSITNFLIQALQKKNKTKK